jgi:hypothetical protein
VELARESGSCIADFGSKRIDLGRHKRDRRFSCRKGVVESIESTSSERDPCHASNLAPKARGYPLDPIPDLAANVRAVDLESKQLHRVIKSEVPDTAIVKGVCGEPAPQITRVIDSELPKMLAVRPLRRLPRGFVLVALTRRS